jgi:peptidoglycan/LPS O-acetylase OafA/YrhL
MASSNFKTNNFDLIRLAAASQVAITHAMNYLDVPIPGVLTYLLPRFPGVPIFFFVSGFLISRTYELNPNLWDYARNRALRIYPGLILCFLVSLALVWSTGYFANHHVAALPFCGWVAAQLSAFQFINPEFMRDFGCGVLNGSLWTISVELQFYLLTPLIYRLLGLFEQPNSRRLLAAVAVGAAANALYWSLTRGGEMSSVAKLVFVSFVPWLYMFLCGIFVQRHFDRIEPFIAGRGLVFAAAYLVYANAITILQMGPTDNRIPVWLFIPLVVTVLSLAYTRRSLAGKLLIGNDISYGIYIYHMPIINTVLEFGVPAGGRALAMCSAATLGLAGCSWWLIEKPCIRLKRNALRGTGGPRVT